MVLCPHQASGEINPCSLLNVKEKLVNQTYQVTNCHAEQFLTTANVSAPFKKIQLMTTQNA